MSLAYKATSAVAAVSAASEIDLNTPSSSFGDLLVSVIGVEGVAGGSGPWIDANVGQLTTDYGGPFTGWKQVAMIAPSATGVGVEVWAALYSSGTHVWWKFNANQSAVARMVTYTGAYSLSNQITDGAVRAAATNQWTGNNPQAPSIYAYLNEMLLAFAAEEMSSPGYGTPTPAGWTTRFDNARSGYGTAEITVADFIPVTVEGASGVIPWSANGALSTSKGGAGVLAIRPTVVLPAATNPAIRMRWSTAS